MQAFDDDIKEQQGNDHADIPDSIKQDDPDSEPLEELTPAEKEQLTQECEELISKVHSAGYEDGVNDKPFNIEAVDSLISTKIKDIQENVDPADPDALAPEKASQLIQFLEKICRDDYTAGYNEGGEERRQAAEQEKSQEQNQNTKKQETDSATIKLDSETKLRVYGIFDGTYINMIIDELNKLKKDPSFKIARRDIESYISTLEKLKKDLTQFFKQKSDFENYLEDIFENKDLNAIRDIAERIQAFESIIYAIKNMVWQVRSAGETDTEKLYNIKENIKEEYAQYLLPPNNAFGAENFNNMKGDRDAKIAGQIVALNQQLDKEKKAYTKNLQNKYAQAMVDTWTQGDLPEWVQAKLDEKGKEETDENLLKIALKAVESNWADDDDRDDYRYKNKSKKTTLTGANIVAALIRTWVIAVLLADEVQGLPKDLTEEKFKNFFAEDGDNFQNLRGSGNSPNEALTKTKEAFKATIRTTGSDCIPTADYIKIQNWFKQGILYVKDIKLNDNPIASLLDKVKKVAQNNNLTTWRGNEIYSLKDAEEYFNGQKFDTTINEFFDKTFKNKGAINQA